MSSLDENAERYERVKEQYAADEATYEELTAAWDVMVEAVEEAGHEVDSCPCRSCTLYRAETVESGQDGDEEN